jgi:hypothetical protein
MSLENRVSVVEEAIVIMKDLLVSHDERLESYFNALNSEQSERENALNAERTAREESRKDFDFKLNALIDAQIRNQDEISELKEASKSILKRVEGLENQ